MVQGKSSLIMATHISGRVLTWATCSYRKASGKPRIHQVAHAGSKRFVERCAQDVSDIMNVADDIRPQDFDVLLTDFGERELRTNVAREFTTEFLAYADPQVSPQWPVNGIVYGKYYRVIVELNVKRRDAARTVFFLLGTGSPFTYLSPSTLQALGFSDSVPKSLQASVHGQRMTVYSSPQASHFKDINLLGSDFLSVEQCQLGVDYKLLTAELVHAPLIPTPGSS